MSLKNYFSNKTEQNKLKKQVQSQDSEASKDMPSFVFDENTIKIEGRATPEFADFSWWPFLDMIKDFMSNKKNVKVIFNLDYFNTSSSRYVTEMFSIFSQFYPSCIVSVDWYIDEDDEKSETNVEIIKESHPKVKLNIICRK